MTGVSGNRYAGCSAAAQVQGNGIVAAIGGDSFSNRSSHRGLDIGETVSLCGVA